MKIRPIHALAWMVVLDFAAVVPSLAQPTDLANNGGHFRFATIYWKQVEDDTSNKVQITVESAWRRSYHSNYFAPAQDPTGQTIMKINGRESPLLDFGDGTIQYLENVVITAYSVAEDWFMGTQVFTKTYDTPSNMGQPWAVHFKGCCRVSNLENNRDASWDIWTTINLLEASSSPRIVSLPVIFLQSGVIGQFLLSTADGASSPAAAAAVQWSADPARPNPPGVVIDPLGSVTVTLTCPATAGAGGAPAYCLFSVVAYAAAAGGGSGLVVPVDLILNVTLPSVPAPRFGAAVAGAAWAAAVRPGFELRLDIEGYMQQPAAAAGGDAGVGFTVGPLPVGARLSAVRGKGVSADAPAVMTLRWNPSSTQLGSEVACFDVVSAVGVASTMRCLALQVSPDEPPSVSVSLDGTPLTPTTLPPHKCPTGPPCLYAETFIGAAHTLTITATDPNPLDTLTLLPVPTPPGTGCPAAAANGTAPCPLLPPGATLSEAAAAAAPSGGGVAVARTLAFAPGHDQGGYLGLHCFQASDSCGVGGPGDECPGGLDRSPAVCVWVQVRRCRFIVRPGQQLQQVAAVYQTDWLQLWSLNQWILNPDLDVRPNQVLNIGHDYAVQPFDLPSAVAARFGMSPAAFAALNADTAAPPAPAGAGAGAAGGAGGALADRPACASVSECEGRRWCVMPNSCAGASGSVYDAERTRYKDPNWFPGVLTAGAPTAAAPSA